MSGIRFSATVHKLGINPCVDVPEPVVTRLLHAACRTSGPVPVKGTINQTPIVATVVKYQGAWRLYLNSEMRRVSGVDVGDTVTVTLSFDPRPRVLPIPKQLEQALGKHRKAKAIWDQLAPSHRREYLSYLNSLKTAATLERNVEKVIRSLRSRHA